MIESRKSLEDEGKLGKGGPEFSPRLYKQRYLSVLELARKLQPRKVVDIGCAECKLLRLLKKEDYIEELIGVDVDAPTLRMNSHLVKPLVTDYLHPRPRPLYMALMQGSIAQPDARLLNCDLLTCIEVVEHLDSPVLDAVPASLFQSIRPQTVIISTPNSEFNVLFPGFTGFRHYDHRFEWNRLQFQTWCEGIACSHGYCVEFSGVGNPPPERENVGYCTQIAFFTRNSQSDATITPSLSSPYLLIAEAVHPHHVSSLSDAEKLRFECEYYLNLLLRSREAKSEEERDGSSHPDTWIALKELLIFPKVKALCNSVEDIRTILQGGSSVQLDPTAEFAILSPQEEQESEDSAEEHVACPDEANSIVIGTSDEFWD